MNNPRPTDDPNAYGAKLVQPTTPTLSSASALAAPVNTVTPSDVIKSNLESAKLQNQIVNANSGKVTSGGKRSHKKSHKKSHKRSHKSHKKLHKKSHKRSHKKSHKRSDKRSKWGGDVTPTPTPRPTATVPQFGSLHSGANAASINLNSGAMLQDSQAKYDNPNAPPSTKYFP